MKDAILLLAARPQGMTRLEVPGLSAKAGGNRLARMCKAGELYRHVLTYRDIRYFATAEAAERYVAPPKVKPNAPPVTIKAGPKFDPDAPMIFTSKTKYTFAPTPVRCLKTNTHSQ
jgi:hypothetical protein